jgi:hypothetical protein
VSYVGSDFEERREGSDEFEVVADDRRAPDILLGIGGDCALGFAERGEIMKLDLGAFYGE